MVPPGVVSVIANAINVVALMLQIFAKVMCTWLRSGESHALMSTVDAAMNILKWSVSVVWTRMDANYNPRAWKRLLLRTGKIAQAIAQRRHAALRTLFALVVLIMMVAPSQIFVCGQIRIPIAQRGATPCVVWMSWSAGVVMTRTYASCQVLVCRCRFNLVTQLALGFALLNAAVTTSLVLVDKMRPVAPGKTGVSRRWQAAPHFAIRRAAQMNNTVGAVRTRTDAKRHPLAHQ
jgi:hypothetical protein